MSIGGDEDEVDYNILIESVMMKKARGLSMSFLSPWATRRFRLQRDGLLKYYLVDNFMKNTPREKGSFDIIGATVSVKEQEDADDRQYAFEVRFKDKSLYPLLICANDSKEASKWVESIRRVSQGIWDEEERKEREAAEKALPFKVPPNLKNLGQALLYDSLSRQKRNPIGLHDMNIDENIAFLEDASEGNTTYKKAVADHIAKMKGLLVDLTTDHLNKEKERKSSISSERDMYEEKEAGWVMKMNTVFSSAFSGHTSSDESKGTCPPLPSTIFADILLNSPNASNKTRLRSRSPGTSSEMSLPLRFETLGSYTGEGAMISDRGRDPYDLVLLACCDNGYEWMDSILPQSVLHMLHGHNLVSSRIVELLGSDKVNRTKSGDLDSDDAEFANASPPSSQHQNSAFTTRTIDSVSTNDLVKYLRYRDSLTGHTPLHVACRQGHLACIQVLLWHSVNDITGRRSASRDGYISSNENRPSKDNGDSDNIPVYLDLFQGNNQGRTPLHKAVEGGHIGCITFLINFIREYGDWMTMDENETEVTGDTNRSGSELDTELVLGSTSTDSNDLPKKLMNIHNKLTKEEPRHKRLLSLFLNSADSNGITALHLAVRYGYRSIVSLLLKEGSDIFAEGRLVLIGDSHPNKELLREYADMKDRGSYQVSGSPLSVKSPPLYIHSTGPTLSPISAKGAMGGRQSPMGDIYPTGNKNNRPRRRSSYGDAHHLIEEAVTSTVHFTVLHTAAEYGHDEILGLLFEHLHEIEKNMEKDGESVVHNAAAPRVTYTKGNNHTTGRTTPAKGRHDKAALKAPSKVRNFLEKVRMDNGWGVVHYAAYSGSVKCLEVCQTQSLSLQTGQSVEEDWVQLQLELSNLTNLKKGAMSVRDSVVDHATDLDKGIGRYSEVMVNFVNLVAKIYKSISTDPLASHMSPLHIACFYGHEDVIRFLYTKLGETCWSDRDDRERVPLHYAVLGNNTQVLDTIIGLGANVREIDEDCNTALHLAVIMNLATMVTTLIQKYMSDEDREVVNEFGHTAMEIASMSGLQLTSLIKVMVAAEETNDEDMLASLEDATVVTNSKDGRASVVTDAAIKDTPEILNGISDEIPVFKDTRRDSYNPSIANKFYDKKAIEGEPEKMNDEKDKAMVLT